MRHRATSAKVKAEARRPHARKAPKKQAAGTRELEKRLAEALEQQSATAEILRVISSSPTDIQPVLDVVAESAARLCEATEVVIRRLDGGRLRIVAHFGSVPLTVDAHEITRGSVGGRAVLECRTVHVHDVLSGASRKEYPDTPALQSKAGQRTILAVPLVREGAATGYILMRRLEVRPFTDKQIQLLETFAAQAVIAIENVRLFNETKEALEQQTATADVLKLISRTTFELQPVLDTLVRSAAELCEAQHALYYRIDPDGLRPEAWHNVRDEYITFRKANPIPVASNFVMGRATLMRQPVHMHDRFAEPGLGSQHAVRLLEMRTVLGVPVLRDGEPIGVIGIFRQEVRPFTRKQIELVTTFADQAAIAIGNVRLFKELQARNVEVTESLEQQTATSEVLKIISSSPGELEPVFQGMLANATRICEASFGNLLLYEGDVFRHVALHNAPPAWADEQERDPIPPRHVARVLYRVADTKQVTHIADMTAANPDEPIAIIAGARTVLIVPMLKDNELVGVIAIYRQEVRPFTDKQIALLTSFANQAVIAVENTRLLNELRESLEQQTATADILRVISSSPTDLQPVFDAILEKAISLCDAHLGHLGLYDGEKYQFVAQRGARAEYEKYLSERGPFRPSPSGGSVIARMIAERQPIHVADRRDSPEYRDRDPGTVALVEVGGGRTNLTVPMLKEGRVVGGISIYRPEVRPFTQKQIDLVSTFANQAVIAIENVRLFNETKEALEQQTVISEILRVISSSPTDVQPVFDTIVKSGVHLFGGMDVSLRLVRGNHTETAASTYPIEEPIGVNPVLLADDRSPASRTIVSREIVQVPDLFAEDVPAGLRRRAEQNGLRALLSAPLLRENTAIGAIQVMSPKPGPFSDKQIALLQTFADQAVIAIENVRLFKELQARNAEITEALKQQTATAEILQVISSSPTDLQPVFDAILEKATQLCDSNLGILGLYDGENYQFVAVRTGNADVQRWALNRGPFRPHPGGPLSRVLREGQAINVGDVKETAEYRDRRPMLTRLVDEVGVRSHLQVPMLKEGRAVGIIYICRSEAQPFTQRQVDLLSTFANQAVIAIENVRLFKELQARNAEVTEALEQQTATAEILKVISSSPTNTQPVFDAVAESAARLCGAHDVVIRLVEGNEHHVVAHHGPIPIRPPFVVTRATMVGRAIVEARTVHIPDVSGAHVQEEYPESRSNAAGRRTLLAVPMVLEGRAIGVILMRRQEVRPFTDKQIQLLETFAAQAVIAIENVRLFKETKEALEQQTATAEILKVISSSPTDTQPVFDAVAESAARLCGAHDVVIRLVDGDEHRAVAHHGPIPVMPPHAVARANPGGRAIVEARTIHIPDFTAEHARKEYPGRWPGAAGQRTFLGVPLVREERAIGIIVLRRLEARPFTDKQIQLLETFAAQAVIAIENVRLFNETKEALEQQTVVSEILRVISSSPTNVQPVFDAIVKSGTRLFRDMDISLRLVRGNHTETAASTYPIEEPIGVNPVLLADDRSPASRTIVSREIVQVPDLFAEDVPAGLRRRAEQNGLRALLSAPLLRENTAIGAIQVMSPKPGPFSDKQIALLQTFADQAVIAIENVRLFKELQARNAEVTEALEQQTATAEVLKVISRSTFDLETVLQTLTDNAAILCRAKRGVMFRRDGDVYRLAATYNVTPELREYLQSHPVAPDRATISGRSIMEKRPVHVHDVLADSEYQWGDAARLGNYRTVLSVPLLREGEPMGMIALTRDAVEPFSEQEIALVTTFADQATIAIENVRLFNEIQDKSRQLEVASRHKSQFLANMSHELRTPLNAILGYTELVLDGIYGEVSEKVRDVMGRVDKSGRHLLGLINDVLDLSKIEAGQLTLALADYSLTDVAQTVITSVESLAAEKKLALKATLAPDLPRGRGDDRRLAQVLLNLLGNAIKFTEAGEVRLEARCADGEFVVAVADTGPGISEADQQRIFEEFQQVDDSATRKKGGTGLGLSIARRIIELHGGRIRVESAPGRGATFTVTLPVRVERQAVPA